MHGHLAVLFLLGTSILCCALEPVRTSASVPDPGINLPPLITYTPEDPVTGERARLRLLGPLFESVKRQDGSAMHAFRPLWSTESKADRRSAADIAAPLSIYRRTRSGSYFWLLPFFSSTGKDGANGQYLFPLLFRERHADGRLSWFLFPLYGNMYNFFTYQRIRFFLFPFRKSSVKNGILGSSWFWPVFHLEFGPKEHGLRIFPLYAERVHEGIRENRSYLWPLLNTARSLKEGADDFAFYSIPFGGYEKWGPVTNLAVLPPLFADKTVEGNQRTISILWPFFKYGKDLRSDEGSCLYFWPLWGNALSENAYYSFFLWPLGLNLNTLSPERRTVWRTFLPFYLSRNEYARNDGKMLSGYTHLFPFVSRRSDKTESALRGLDLIPVKEIGMIERNYAPFWRLFQTTQNERGISFDILWGFVKGFRTVFHASGFTIGPFYTEEHRGVNSVYDICFGLVHLENRKLRLFYCLDF